MDRIGVLFTLAAYLLWGLFPLYFHALQDVSALEILAHRIVWSLVVTAAILMALRRGEWIRGLVKEPRTLAIFTGSALLIGLNWGTYVYSIVSGQTIEASLGYFINPLMSVALGGALSGRAPLEGPAWSRGSGGCGRPLHHDLDGDGTVPRSSSGRELCALRPHPKARASGKS